MAAAARDRSADAVGVDFSAAQVRLAERSYRGIRFIEGDAEDLLFTDAEFDVVFNAFGLPHVPNPDVATAEAYWVLKPGGRFVYATWSEAAKCEAAIFLARSQRRSRWSDGRRACRCRG